jgi:hypothetical protein
LREKAISATDLPNQQAYQMNYWLTDELFNKPSLSRLTKWAEKMQDNFVVNKKHNNEKSLVHYR